MSIQERFGNIANAAWQGTDSAFEFLTDIPIRITRAI